MLERAHRSSHTCCLQAGVSSNSKSAGPLSCWVECLPCLRWSSLMISHNQRQSLTASNNKLKRWAETRHILPPTVLQHSSRDTWACRGRRQAREHLSNCASSVPGCSQSTLPLSMGFTHTVYKSASIRDCTPGRSSSARLTKPHSWPPPPHSVLKHRH